MTGSLSYKMQLEVYLQTAVLRGVLETNQDRLSSPFLLREGDEVFLLKSASLGCVDGTAVTISPQEYLIYMQEIFLIADLTSQIDRSGLESLFVAKEVSRTLISIGPYWLQGNIHVLPGGALHELLLAKTRFIPVTDATILDGGRGGNVRTYLVNRTKIGFITTLQDTLAEL